MIKIALNGGKPKEESPNLPTTFEEYKKEIDWFQAHGLQSRLPGTLHHPKKIPRSDGCGFLCSNNSSFIRRLHSSLCRTEP